MKTWKSFILATGLASLAFVAGTAQPVEPPTPADPASDAAPAAVPESAAAQATEPAEPPVAETVPADAEAAAGAAAEGGEQAGTNAPPLMHIAPTAPKPTVIVPSAAGAGTNAALTPGQIRMNFRGAPLDMVLNHLSEAAGFIIVLETEVRGRVDAWSNQPLSSDEAVELLSTVLAKNGYAMLRNGRTLTVISRDEAKKRDIPVKSSNKPDDIPKNEEIVTQIIPVRFISAVALVRDLQPLLPATATLTANEGGNALVMTDTQINIRRMSEIIRALDTAISSVSSVRVFPLKFADAKSLASIVKDLFATDTTRSGQGQGGQQGRFMNFFRGGGGGPGGGGGVPGATDASGGRAPSPKVTAVADERSNSLVVSAPEEQMPVIEDLVTRIDTNVEDVTELRVFRLKYADPQETADLLTSLFPDSTGTSGNTRGQVQFGGRGGGPFGGFGGGANSSSSASSSRLQKQTRVIAVADNRTRSVVVSAARELLEQITPMVAQLDADPAKNQKVHVFSVENADPTAVQDLLKGLFETQNSRNRTTTSNTRQTGNQLNTRANQNQNQRTSSSSGFGGSSAFGSGSR